MVVAHKALPMEIWHAKDGIKTYTSVGDFLKAIADFNKVAQKLNATYALRQDDRPEALWKNGFLRQGEGWSDDHLPAQAERCFLCRGS